MDSSRTPSIYRQESTSLRTSEFEPVELARRMPSKAKLTRRLLYATAVENEHSPKHCVEVRLVYQKRYLKGAVDEGNEWIGLQRRSLKELSAGEEIQIDLDSTQTAQLFEQLKDWYAVASKGVYVGTTERAVISRSQLEELGPLLESSPDDRRVLLGLIGKADPVGLELVALKARHERHSEALEKFRVQLDLMEWSEKEWETFFRSNKWIFGHGLAFQFLSEIREQANFGGKNVGGTGGQIGDRLMATEAARRFTVLVEVKTPQAPLVKGQYRNGVSQLGEDLAGGVSQLQMNCRQWAVEGSRAEGNRGLEDRQIYTVEPKGVLVVGNTRSLSERDMWNTFQLFRRELHNPEIITFDELYERAKHLVGHDLAEQES